MKRLLVASIFAPAPRNETWYDLQLGFLEKTLGDDFDHAVYLNRVQPDIFVRSSIIGSRSPNLDFDWNELDVATAAVIRYFEEHTDYASYLILDSDAFPFRVNWIDELQELMAPRRDFGLARRGIAAPIRAENLDSKPHGCVFFIDGAFLRSRPSGSLRLVTQVGHNVAGMPTEDMFFDDSTSHGADGSQAWYPLVRTNVWNPHPIVSAIYGHMFYHHGAGSRRPIFRVMQAGTHSHYLSDLQQVAIEELLFEWLARDPDSLLAELVASPEVTLRRLMGFAR